MNTSFRIGLVTGFLLILAQQAIPQPGTNAPPTRTTVAVLPWLPAEPPPLAPEDAHWLQTCRGLVSSELRQIAALRVLPESAILRELARQKRDDASNTNASLGMRKLAKNLGAQWVIAGALTRTGTTWTVHAHAVDATLGQSKERFTAAATNWFELRDRVVGHVLRRLDIAPSPEERKLLGRVWTLSLQALEWLSQAMSTHDSDQVQVAELSRKALGADPQFVEAGALLAASLYNCGRDEEALAVAKEALNQKPDRFLAAGLRLLNACVLLRQGREGQARQEVAEGLCLSPDDAELLTLQSSLYERDGDLEAASECLRRASECDPRNPATNARLGRLKSKQGELTNALAHLELARQWMVDTSLDEQVDIQLALAKAYEMVGNLTEALHHYRDLLAAARDWEIPESRLKWVEEIVHELERRSQPVPVEAEKPKQYSSAELQAALRERLTPDELTIAVDPVATTPEMVRWAGELVAGAQDELMSARRLFEELASRPKAAGGGTRTAQEVFAAWKDLSQPFVCQEYAKLFVALARSSGLSAFYAHVERDYCDRIVDHDCAVVFVEGKAWLVDPAYAWFGVPHVEFRVLDDLETVAHHAFQPHTAKPGVALCRAGCKLDPDFAWGRMNLAGALLESGQIDEAGRELARARKSAPDYWRGYQLEGLLAVEQGRNDQAIEWLRKAAQANPDHGDTRLVLAQRLFQAGKQAEARDELLAGLRRSHSPKNEELAREMLTLLEAAVGVGSNVLTTAKAQLDAPAYENLGLSFLSGSTPNYTEAAKWFRKAADMGHPSSQLALGVLYWNGRGVPKDAVIAVGWLRKAADAGDPAAMRNLAIAYDRGVGVDKSPEEAWRWLRRAAEGGDSQAQVLVGKAHYEGKWVPQDLAEALFWLTLGAQTNAAPPAVWVGDSEGLTVVRQAPHLLKEVELFASPEEKAAAKTRLGKHKASP